MRPSTSIGSNPRLVSLLSNKPWLLWWVKDIKNLSEEAASEAVILHGDWQDFTVLTKELGLKKTAAIFHKLAAKKRTNLPKEYIQFFTRYFQAHAS